MMAMKVEDRTFISIKHQANPSLLLSQSAAGSNYLYLFLCIYYKFVPCYQGDRLLPLTFQECINPGDKLKYGEGQSKRNTSCSSLVPCKSWEQIGVEKLESRNCAYM